MKLKIYLDFDGTVVEHTFPAMGRCNFGCFEVIKKLQDAGHELILNTYRADIGAKELADALKVVNEYSWRLLKVRLPKDDYDIVPLIATDKKIHPDNFDIKKSIERGILFIDDMSYGTPLKPAAMSNGQMVDWDKLDILFEEAGLYTTVA